MDPDNPSTRNAETAGRECHSRQPPSFTLPLLSLSLFPGPRGKISAEIFLKGGWAGRDVHCTFPDTRMPTSSFHKEKEEKKAVSLDFGLFVFRSHPVVPGGLYVVLGIQPR